MNGSLWKCNSLAAHGRTAAQHRDGFRVWPYANRNRARFVASTCAHRPGEGGVGEKHGQCGRSGRATEVSGTQPRQTCGAQAERAPGPHGTDASAQMARREAPRKRGPPVCPCLSRQRETPTSQIPSELFFMPRKSSFAVFLFYKPSLAKNNLCSLSGHIRSFS